MLRKYQRWTCDTPNCLASVDEPIARDCPRAPNGWARVTLSFDNGEVKSGGVICDACSRQHMTCLEEEVLDCKLERKI
jgi:hypothetical protein